jgi:two-component system phosphate regulon response regulator PhoB
MIKTCAILSIYILDYDTDITYALCEWFKQNGFRATGFSNSIDLFNQLKASPPDCIILDCLFGGLTATTDLCHLIRNVFHYKGRIVLSSTGNISEKEWKECDAVDFIAKPFDLWEVLDKVNKTFGDTLAKDA